MNDTGRRERPPEAGTRSGSGAGSLLPYIDQDEDEKAGETGAQDEADTKSSDDHAGLERRHRAG
jgi:hypothetical protein